MSDLSAHRDRAPISQTVSGILPSTKKSQTPSATSTLAEIRQTASDQSRTWTLSWPQYLFQMGIKDPDERAFYENASALRADHRACLAALENMHVKYTTTAVDIEQRRSAATSKLKGFLRKLGYA